MAEEAVQPAPPELPETASVGELIGHAVGAAVTAMKEHQEGLRAGIDPDHVRKTRVAVRRLRSNLRTFGEFLDTTRTEPVVAELGALAAELGGVRDREVLIARLRAGAKLLPEGDRGLVDELTGILDVEIRVARASAVAFLDSQRFTTLFADLDSLAVSPPLNEAAARRAIEVAGPLAAGPWEKLRKGVRGLRRNPPDAQLHRVRILAKRSRYAAQAVAPVVGEPARTFARAAAELQTVLGDHQDAVTAESWLASAPTSGRAAFVAGQLAGLERAVALEAREKWPAAWSALDLKELRAWMAPPALASAGRAGPPS
jgi:CHAD domain-containing protein